MGRCRARSSLVSRILESDDAELDAAASIPPSTEVSPGGSSVSARSSAPGTPMRRSVRIALRERTPEPSLPEALTASLGRIRRHSAGPLTDAHSLSSPLRRAGIRALNLSRDHSPTDSVTSEPPPRTETTPSGRKKSARVLKSAHKSAALNLLPVEEESESLQCVVSSPLRRSGRKSSISRDPSPTGSVSSEPPPRTETTPMGRKRATSRSTKAQALNLLPVEEAKSCLPDDDDTASDNEELLRATAKKSSVKRVSHGEEVSGNEKKSRKGRSQSSLGGSMPSSPSSSRYNLRRTRRASELEIIAEAAEAAAASAASAAALVSAPDAAEAAAAAAAPPPKRRRDTQSEDSSDAALSTGESSKKAESKRRKKTDVEPSEPSSDELHFVRRPKPPKNLPKRDPVIKTRNGPRRSMRLD